MCKFLTERDADEFRPVSRSIRIHGHSTSLRLEACFWRALDDVPAVPAFDLVVSNPPYIAADDPHLAALVHEPIAALVADDDGLADIARITDGAASRLRSGGWLLFEHGWQQASAVRALLERAGFIDVTTREDIEGRPRCSGGRRPGTP